MPAAPPIYIDRENRLIFGWGLLAKQNGDQYVDRHGNGFHEFGLTPAALAFMEQPVEKRYAMTMHENVVGQTVMTFPLTTPMCKALHIVTPRTGLLVALRVDDAVIAKIDCGELKTISYGIRRHESHAPEV